MPKTHHLDVTGTLCPLPILLTARVVADLPPGDHLEIVGDDPGILDDLPAWCEETGHPLVEIERRGKLVRGVVRKAGGAELQIRP